MSTTTTTHCHRPRTTYDAPGSPPPPPPPEDGRGGLPPGAKRVEEGRHHVCRSSPVASVPLRRQFGTVETNTNITPPTTMGSSQQARVEYVRSKLAEAGKRPTRPQSAMPANSSQQQQQRLQQLDKPEWIMPFQPPRNDEESVQLRKQNSQNLRSMVDRLHTHKSWMSYTRPQSAMPGRRPQTVADRPQSAMPSRRLQTPTSPGTPTRTAEAGSLRQKYSPPENGGSALQQQRRPQTAEQINSNATAAASGYQHFFKNRRDDDGMAWEQPAPSSSRSSLDRDSGSMSVASSSGGAGGSNASDKENADSNALLILEDVDEEGEFDEEEAAMMEAMRLSREDSDRRRQTDAFAFEQEQEALQRAAAASVREEQAAEARRAMHREAELLDLGKNMPSLMFGGIV